jgi:hypothetical protein
VLAKNEGNSIQAGILSFLVHVGPRHLSFSPLAFLSEERHQERSDKVLVLQAKYRIEPSLVLLLF